MKPDLVVRDEPAAFAGVPDGVTCTPVGDPSCWVLWRAPDGNCVEGTGTSLGMAQADAERTWYRWHAANPRRLRADGREYRRRQQARRRRKRL